MFLLCPQYKYWRMRSCCVSLLSLSFFHFAMLYTTVALGNFVALYKGSLIALHGVCKRDPSDYSERATYSFFFLDSSRHYMGIT